MNEFISVTIRGDNAKAEEVAASIRKRVGVGTKVEVQSGDDVTIHTVPEAEREWLVEYLRQEFA